MKVKKKYPYDGTKGQDIKGKKRHENGQHHKRDAKRKTKAKSIDDGRTIEKKNRKADRQTDRHTDRQTQTDRLKTR